MNGVIFYDFMLFESETADMVQIAEAIIICTAMFGRVKLYVFETSPNSRRYLKTIPTKMWKTESRMWKEIFFPCFLINK